MENNRHTDSSDTTEANIRDYYTAPFRDLIQDWHVSGLMTAYNRVNGTPAPADTYLVNALAQRTYGFEGYTTSDCGAVADIYQPNRHNWAPPGWTTTSSGGTAVWTNDATGQRLSGAAGGQAYALRAGTQLNCTGSDAVLSNISEAIDAGVLSEGVLDDALTRVFTMRMRTGEFDPPARVPYTSITKDVIESPEHAALAEKVATNSLVLLKNDNLPGTSTALLPADPASLDTVVIVGDLANTVTLGGYSGAPSVSVTAVQGITAAVRAANPDASVVFDACGTSTTATGQATCSASTEAAIQSADLVIVFAGTDANVAGESRDRTTLALPGNYRSLIDKVAALGNARSVLALQTGGPVAIEDVQDRFPAVVFSGYNGQSQGAALANVLFGKHNPSARLNFTWYADDSQLPAMSNYGLSPSETGGLGRTYQHFTGTPSYPFGYGLSYTNFAHSDLDLDRRRATGDDTVRVSFTVTNTGATAGATVGQVYVAGPAGGVSGRELPIKQLRGFAKTRVLRPGESQRISLPVPIAGLSVWNDATKRQEVVRGAYEFQLGSDSATVTTRRSLLVTADATPRLQQVTVQPATVVFAPGDRLDLTGANPWIADNTGQADRHVRADGIVEAVRSDQTFVDLAHARVTYRSSNPNVARVSRTGVVTAVAGGVATLSVTVDGVTGSTPVVVKQPFTLTVPALTLPGQLIPVTATLPNPGATPLTDVTFASQAPSGWTVQATSPTTFASVAPGQTARVTWEISVPEGVPPGVYEVSTEVGFTDPTGRHTVGERRATSVPYPSVAAAYTNAGTSDDGANAGSLDGAGRSYSAQALAAATPRIAPGADVVHDGLSFTWPDAPPGTPDNIVAGGQAVAVTGSGDRLGLLGAASSGSASGTATITYTDGTTQEFTLSFTDWWANAPAAGGAILATLPYHNRNGGRADRAVSLYVASVGLRPGKTVRFVTLPDISQDAGSGLAMHVFAVGIG